MPQQTRLDVRIPGATPAQVADALRARTRRYQRPWAVPPGWDSDEPLIGIIGKDMAHVSLHDGARGIRASARFRLDPAGDGTRAVGLVGLPPAVTWLMRIFFVLAFLGCGMVAFFGIPAAPWVAAPVLLAMVLTLIVIGVNVARANQDRGTVAAGVETTLAGLGPALARHAGVAVEVESA